MENQSSSSVKENEEQADDILLEDEDPAVAASLPSGRLEQARGRIGKRNVEVEHEIVYSKTYRVPMLCLKAYDECE